MEELNYKDIALSRLTDRHRDDPAFLALLETLVEIKVLRQQQYLSIADAFLDIDKSSGKNLDVIGKLIGEERNLVNFIDRAYFGFLGARLAESYDVGYWYSLYKDRYGTLRTLTDEEYRRVLKARVVKNSSNSNREDFLRVLNLLTNNSSSLVKESIDNKAIQVSIKDEDGLASYYLSKYKNDNNLIPIPLGRRLGITQQSPKYFTSKPYQYLETVAVESFQNLEEFNDETVTYEPENISTNFYVSDGLVRNPAFEYIPEIESVSSTLNVESFQITQSPSNISYTPDVEGVNSSLNVSEVQITKTVSYISYTPETESVSSNITVESFQITN